MKRRYKQGDIGIYHGTLNRGEEAFDAVFGTNVDGPSLRRVRLKPGRILEPHSVVQLGSTMTPFGRVLTLELPDNLSEGSGPCYTNHVVRTNTTTTYWFEPIDSFPQLLRVDGMIETGQTASVTDAGEAKQGSGPLQAVSEVDNGMAWFVYVAPQTVKYGRLPVGDEINFGDTFTMRVFRNGTDTGETIEDVRWDKFPHNEPGTDQHDMKIRWVADENLWRLDNLECPPEAP